MLKNRLCWSVATAACAALALAGTTFGQACADNVAACQAPNLAAGNNGSGSANVDAGCANGLAGTARRFADNFAVNANGNITGLCVYGCFQAGPPAGNSLSVDYFADNNGVPGALLASYVCSDTPGLATATPGTTITRGPVLPAAFTAANGVNPARPFSYAFTLTHPPLPVTANTPVWVSVYGNGYACAQRFRWFFTNGGAAPFADGVFYFHDGGVTDAFVVGDAAAGDQAFCVTGTATAGGAPLQMVSIVVPAQNRTCDQAQTLSLPTSNLAIDTRAGELTPNTPFCTSNVVGSKTLWYKIVGNGTTLTADTCGASTLDTILAVYCGTCASGGNFTGLNCVGSNDTADTTVTACAGTDSSRISFPTRTGTTYYIAVFGYQGGSGAAVLNLSSDNTQVATQPTCASDRCVVDTTGSTVADGGVCGTSTFTDCTSAATQIAGVVGTLYSGTSYTTGTTRGFDYYEFPTQPVESWYNVGFQSEFPVLFRIYIGACTATQSGDTALGIGAGYCQTNFATGIGEFRVPANTPFRILVSTVDFDGLPCTIGANTYKLQVRAVTTLGSCCVTGTSCDLTPQQFCLDQNDPTAGTVAVWTGGQTCTAPSGIADLCLSRACCNNGVCSVSLVSSCIGGGGTASNDTSCTGVNCPPPAGGVCCRGVTCTTGLTAGTCTSVNSNGVTINASFVSASNACNNAGVLTAPCCYGNFDRSADGVQVADIFAFLSAFFANSPYAVQQSTTGGAAPTGTPGVPDIFNFLSSWFGAGGCV